MYFH